MKPKNKKIGIKMFTMTSTSFLSNKILIISVYPFWIAIDKGVLFNTKKKKLIEKILIAYVI